MLIDFIVHGILIQEFVWQSSKAIRELFVEFNLIIAKLLVVLWIKLLEYGLLNVFELLKVGLWLE